MSAPTKQELEPLFAAYGHAVHAAQLLESGLRLLLAVVDFERRKSGLPPISIELDMPDSQKSLGPLFKDVLRVEYVTEAEQRVIRGAIRDRNILVHSYWGQKQTLAMLKPRGRTWLIGDLVARANRCRSADRIVTSLIDKYLEQYGTSIDALSVPLFETWENDEEPPEEVLH